MIKFNPQDGETKVHIHVNVDLLQLLRESETAAIYMGYTHDLRCFCNYMIAHYDGFWNVSGTKYYVHFPLRQL